MNPEASPPVHNSEHEETFEIHKGDVLFVKRNRRGADGKVLFDEEGKALTDFEDGWEVIDLKGVHPETNREGVMLQNTNNPDELKFYSESQLRAIQNGAEEFKAAQAAARMLALEPQVESVEGDAILEKFRKEIEQDVGEKATEEVVEVAEELDEAEGADALEVETEETGEDESHELVSSAIRQFEMREHYATDELQQGIFTILNSFDEQAESFRPTINVLRTAETVKLGIDRALKDYEESMHQLEGRGIVDYDPRTTLYRSLDQSIGQLYSIRSMVMRVTEQSIVTMKRSAEQFERTVGEVEHEADRDEADIVEYLENLSRNKGIEVPETPRVDGIRSYLRAVNEPLAELNKALFDVDEQYGEVSETIKKLIASVELLNDNVRHGARPNEEQLEEIRRGFTTLVDEERLSQLTRGGNRVVSALETIPRRVPTPAIRL